MRQFTHNAFTFMSFSPPLSPSYNINRPDYPHFYQNLCPVNDNLHVTTPFGGVVFSPSRPRPPLALGWLCLCRKYSVTATQMRTNVSGILRDCSHSCMQDTMASLVIQWFWAIMAL